MKIGPPAVISYAGTTLSMFWSPGNGVSAAQESLTNDTRNDPLNELPPDFVIMLTTPPWSRPYSAEMLAVEIFVSWIASSMNRFRAWPRRFSFTTTPLMRKRFSNDMAPDTMMFPPGPLSWTPGASRTALLSVRPTGSSSRVSDLKVVAAVRFGAISVDELAVTWTVSLTLARPILTLTFMVSPI